MKFDINAARSSGYSDDEIADYLAKENNFDLGAALKSGYSASEVVGFLSGGDAPEAAPVTDTGDETARLAARYKAPGLIERASSALPRPMDPLGLASGRPTGAAPAAQAAAKPSAAPTPYRDRREALDDAVNLLEEGYDRTKVTESFGKAGITFDEIAAHGKKRGSEYFQQQTAPAVDPEVQRLLKRAPAPVTGEIKSTRSEENFPGADVALAGAKGAVTGFKLLMSAGGAGGRPTSTAEKALETADQYLEGLRSAAAVKDDERIGQIMDAAKDGTWSEQVVAAAKAAGVAPASLIAQGLGTSVPVILTSLLPGVRESTVARLTAQIGLGAAQGAGATKEAIYSAVKEDMLRAGVPRIEADERAEAAQSYLGQNKDQIAIGMALGALASSTGVERVIPIGQVGKVLAKSGASKALASAEQNVIGRGLVGGVTEAAPEFLQGSAEQVAQNVALQREGRDIPTFQGAVGTGTLEALAGFGAGALTNAAFGRPITPEEQIAREIDSVNISAAPVNFTPVGAPTQQAGLVDIVVPTAPETTDVSTGSVPPLGAAGGSEQPGNQFGGGVELPGSAVASEAGQRGGSADQPGANVPQAGAVPSAAGKPAAGLNRPFDRATDQDLLARTEASIASQENNNAVVQPAEQWFGRKGDGYATQGDAQQALPGRQRMFPNLGWKVESMANGKFRLAGYSTNQETNLGTQTPQALQGQAQQQQAPAVAGAAGPGVGQSLATGGAAQAQGGVNTGLGPVAAGPVAKPRAAGTLATPEGAATAGLKAPLRLAPPAPLRAVGKAITALKASTGVDAEIDNAPMTEQQQAASAIARLSGRTVTILKADTPGSLPNGFMLPGDSKNIYIANDSDDAPLSIAMHEIYHSLPETQRKALNTQLLQLFRQERRGEFATQFSYDANNDMLLDEEIPAFMVQAVSKRADFWQELRTKMGNKEFAEVAKVILNKLNDIISGAKTEYGDDFVNKYITDVAKARDLLTTAYAEAMQEQGLKPDVAAAAEAQAQPVVSRRAQGAPGNTEENSFENNNADVMPPKMLGADGIMFSLRKIEEVNDAPEITMQDLVGQTVFPILADLTAAGYVYMGKELRGGPYYTLLPSNSKAGLIWANDGKGVASIKNKKAARGVIGLIVAMKQDSHATNNTVANIIFRAVEDEIQKGSVAKADIPKLDGIVRGLSERKAKNKKTGEMEAIFPKFAEFPGFSDRAASEKFLRDMPFEARGLFFEEMTKPTVEDLGLGVVRKVINDTVEPDLRGLNMGDVVMAIRFDPNADTIELGETTGTPEHDSYRYGVKGEVIGKFKRPISFENVFVDLMAERRAAGKDRPAGNYRSLTLRKPEQVITQEIANLVGSDSYKTFKSPAEAKSAVTSAGGGWNVIDRPTGAGVKEFLRTARIYGEGEVPSFEEAKALIKDGKLRIFRLGETENWFSIESRGNKRVMTHIMVAQPGVRRETLFGDMVYQAKANGATHLEVDGVETAIQDQERERPVAPIIAELSAMKDADLVNLGISPKEVNRLNGLIEEDGAEQFSPTSLLMYSKRVQSPADRIKWRKVSDVKTEIGLDALPRHIIPFATFMRTMADKAANGGLTSRDLIKAYTIARSSMNRTAVTTSRIKDAGLVLPENYVEDKIRPEGAFGYWLLSPMGQRYLNAAEVAIVDNEAVADAVKVMAPFGTQNALGKDLERAASGELHTRLPGMAAAIAKAATGKNAVKDWQDATDNLFGVREAKKGFLGSLLGFGQLPTFDARQINVNVKPDSKEDTLRALSSVKAREVVAKLARRMDALSLTMDPEYAPFYQHLAHHAVWDAVGGTETTHSDVVESMLMASNRAKPAFYSQLERVIANVPAKLATQSASQWALWLDSNGPKQGVKKDEVEWSGIKDYLALRGKDKVTSADLQAYLKDGGVKVEERTLVAEEPGVDLDDWMAEWAEENPGRTADAILDGEPWDEILKVAEKSGDTEIVDRISNKNSPAKYGKYTLPGGESYREILLKLPVFGKEKKLQAEEAAMARAIERNDIGMQRAYGPALDALRAEKARFVETYRSSHWDDKNVLAHIRINDRTDADGKRVLFVEEVQSDWGQDGLKKGFGKVTRFEYEAMQDNGQFVRSFRDKGEAEAFAKDRGLQLKEIPFTVDTGIPAAPFVTKTEGWLNLALKRIAMLAVEEGYDKVAFVNGEQSADRYDLSKQISSISYEPGSKPENEGLLQAWDLDRKMVMSEMVTTDRVEDYIGKEVAVRLLKTDKVMGKHLLDGENIKVGGKGMIKFYDEIVPQALNKLLPKLGGEKLGSVVFGGEDVGGRYVVFDEDSGDRLFRTDSRKEANEYRLAYSGDAVIKEVEGDAGVGLVGEQPGFDVTDKMRETVGAGLPLFSRRAAPETAEFKRWFGDSKVVNESGDPLVVYHGTAGDFAEFDPAMSGGNYAQRGGNRGFFFTNRPVPAGVYAEQAANAYFGDEESPDFGDGTANIMPVYLSLQQPYERKAQGAPDKWFDANNAAIFAAADKAGADGIIVRGGKGFENRSIYIAFEPEQIKSATGNSGEFGENRNILKSNRRQKLVGANFAMEFSSKTDAARIKLQDNALRMKRVIEAVEGKGGTVGEAQNFYDANTLMPGRIQAAVDDFKNEVVRPMLDKAAEFGIDMDELSMYAYAKHAKERNAYIASINPRMPDGGSGMTNDEADNILQMVDLAGDTAKFEELHQALMGIASATRQVMLSEGLITPDEFTALEGAYDNYIPLRGFENVDAETGIARPGIGRGVNIRGAETIRAMGRKSKAGDLIENVIRDYERVISRVEKNDVAKVLLDFVLSNPDPDLWGVDVERSKPGLNKATGLVQYTKAVEKGDDTIGVKVGGQQVYIKFADKELTRALRQAWKDETSGLERATLAMTGWWNDWMRAVLTKYNPAFALINIPRDALWSGTASALAELGPKGLAKYLAVYPKALMASTRQEAGVSGTSNKLFGNPQMDARFAEFRAAGGITGGFYMRSLDDINQELRNELLLAGASARNPWEAIKSLPPFKMAKLTLRLLEFMGAASENATRFALYQASRDVGNSPAKAAILAKDGTTNFNRKGEWGGALNNLYLFFNAAVQGNAQLFKVLKSPAVQASMAGVAGVGMLLALYGASSGGEDDDGEAYWDKIPSYVKERNVVIMLPPGDALAGGIERVGKRGRYITIPVQYGFNIFPNLGYTMADVLRNQADPKRGMTPTKAALHMTSTVFGSVNPFGGAVDLSDGVQVLLAAMPTLVDLPVQIITERGTFGTPSSPQKSPFDKRPDSERMFTSQQDSVSAKIAKALNELGGGNEAKAGSLMGVETSVAPGTIQTLISATTGGLGSFVEQVGTAVMAMTGDDKDLKANKIPFLNKFYGEVDEGANIGKAGERMREVKKLSDEVKAQQKLGLDPELKDEEQRLMTLSNMQEAYQKQSTMIRKREIEIIKDPKMTDAEKKLERKQLQVERDRLATDMNREYLKVVPK